MARNAYTLGEIRERIARSNVDMDIFAEPVRTPEEQRLADEELARLRERQAAPCDCDDCRSGDDAWCCRLCHDLARALTATWSCPECGHVGTGERPQCCPVCSEPVGGGL